MNSSIKNENQCVRTILAAGAIFMDHISLSNQNLFDEIKTTIKIMLSSTAAKITFDESKLKKIENLISAKEAAHFCNTLKQRPDMGIVTHMLWRITCTNSAAPSKETIQKVLSGFRVSSDDKSVTQELLSVLELMPIMMQNVLAKNADRALKRKQEEARAALDKTVLLLEGKIQQLREAAVDDYIVEMVSAQKKAVQQQIAELELNSAPSVCPPEQFLAPVREIMESASQIANN